METSKVCLCCKVEKPESAFSKQPRSNDGRYQYCKECRKNRYQDQKSKISDKQREYRRQNRELFLLCHARKRAKDKGIEFDLREEDITIPSLCPVLGIPMYVGEGKFGPNSPTLDRHDPKKGYVRGNVAVISFRANLLKSNSTIEELEAVLSWMRSPKPNVPKREVVTRKRGGWKNPHGTIPISEAGRRSIAASKRSLSDEVVRMCRALYSEGIPVIEIARQLGLNRKPVYNAVRKIGIYVTVEDKG